MERQPLVLETFVSKEPEQRRHDWLSVVSHELRTPLTVLRLQTQHLRSRLFRQGLYTYGAMLTQMEEQIQKLERLSSDLLNVSAWQTDKLDYVQENVDLNQLLQELAGVMHQMYPMHTIVMRGAQQCVWR